MFVDFYMIISFSKCPKYFSGEKALALMCFSSIRNKKPVTYMQRAFLFIKLLQIYFKSIIFFVAVKLPEINL